MKVKLVVMILLGSLVLALPAAAANVGVEINDNSYDPSRVTIRPGDTVVWTNKGNNEHTVNGSWGDNSGDIASGNSYSEKFDSSGTFSYFCAKHSGMSGSVVVQEAEPPPPEESASPEPEPSPSPSKAPSPEPEPTPSPAPAASPSPPLAVSETVTANADAEEKGMSLPVKLGIIAIVLIGGSGAGLWYLRKNPA
ncbi:MAG TPA: plastocyanin/azurin family copper-binding protein [Actinomycetota bacterium]|nr:plastocyanin/azurin family copper-binding protein [Actinomycetota bacterium]